ncbi:unnamed protein product [Alternaria alternata]
MVNDNPEDRQTKIQIFWMIYMLDKTLSLRLGRSSILQDWDISLPFVVSSNPDDKNPESSDMLSYWIKVARVQGLTYEKLFCPAAFLKSTEERTRIAIDLVNALNQAWYERGDASLVDFSQPGHAFSLGSERPSMIGHTPNETPKPSQYKRYVHKSPNMGRDPGVSEYIQGKLSHSHHQNQLTDLGKGSFERVQDIFFYSDVVMHYSTVALIQRAVSPSNMSFNQECLESSRAALVAHMRASAQFNKKGQEDLWSGYVHWSVLQAPFTPTMSQFDPYLSALGLMPDTAWPTTTYSTTPASANMNPFGEAQAIHNANESGVALGTSQGNQNPMQDWFSGSRYLLNMMEPGDDLQMPDLDM